MVEFSGMQDASGIDKWPWNDFCVCVPRKGRQVAAGIEAHWKTARSDGSYPPAKRRFGRNLGAESGPLMRFSDSVNG